MASKLVYLALALIVAVASAAPRESSETRIVGGTPTSIEQFPYIVAYVYYYPGPGIFIQRCVGSIISSWHILTTAFCFTGAQLPNMLIRAGSTDSLAGGILSTIRDVIKNPGYVESPRQNDIAVTIINFPLTPSDTIGILYLPPQNWYIPDGTEVKVVSWGFESEVGPQIRNLKTVNLYKLPLDVCKSYYSGTNVVVIEDPVICANAPNPAGMCLGDSGAPMALDNVVVGLSSFPGCGDSDFPDVFTRIDRFTNWIVEVSVPPQPTDGMGAPRVATAE